MKGPGLKLDLDVRRLWKCPQTGETIRLSGDVVSKSTQVEGKTVFMQLVEEKRSLYRDPYHFDFAEVADSDQSSSERAAAAARSITESETIEEFVVTEQHSLEISLTTSDESAAETLPAQDSPEAEPDEEEDSFGGGLL
ncbi:MAG: hypothetical protein KDA77_15780 [Planctomycetaceae bacterium]|nr:hypothetical protein [Planctomycetaceae bacterium]